MAAAPVEVHPVNPPQFPRKNRTLSLPGPSLPKRLEHRFPSPSKTVVPDVSKLKTDLTDTFSKLTEALTSVKDVQSAETALPKLQDLEGKLDFVKTTMKDLGDAGKATIATLVKATEGEAAGTHR